MMKDLLNIELRDVPIEGLHIHMVKKYVVKTACDESFLISNFSILLIKSGQFKIKLGTVTKDLSSQDLVVIPKNSYCTLFGVHDEPQFFLVSFTPEFAFQNCFKKEFADAFYFITAKPSIKIRLDKKDFVVLSLIYKLIYFANQEDEVQGSKQELQRITFNLLLYKLRFIYSKYTDKASLDFTRKEILTVQFLNTLAVHCKRQHGVSFYAGSLFVTSGHLNKIVKQVTDKSVKLLIAEAIIAEAKNMLENSQFSITKIAEELEFSSTSRFCVFFKRYTFLTPSEYRSITIERFKN